MALKQLSDGSVLGTVLGQSATDLVSFHGATAIAKAAVTSVAAAATIATAVSAITELQTALANKGLISIS